MKTIYHISTFCIGIVLLSTMVGCPNSGQTIPDDLPKLTPCKITITQEGAPLEGASVKLRLESKDQQWYPSGRTDASGTVDFYTNGRFQGVPAGKYKVVVTKLESDPSKLAPAPAEDDPKYGEWMEKSQNEVLASYQLIEKPFTDAKTTTLEIEVTQGQPFETTIDVGKKVKDKL